MKRTDIPIKGFRIGKGGKIERDQRRLNVSTRLKKASCERVRVVKKASRP